MGVLGEGWGVQGRAHADREHRQMHGGPGLGLYLACELQEAAH